VFIVGSFGNSGITPEKVLAIAEGRARYLEAGKQKRESITRKITKGIRNSEWWNGTDVADTLTVSSNEQRMPDKNKMQMIVFSPHREDGARVNDDVVNTLLSSMGTGGNNVPMIAATLRSGGDGGVPSSRGENLVVTYPIDDAREIQKNQNGLGIGLDGAPAYTLDRQQAPGVVIAYPMHGAMVGAQDNNGPDGSGFLGENDPSYTLTASSQNRHGVAIIHNPSEFANYSEQEIVGTLRAGMPAGSEPLVQGYKKNIAEKDEEQWMETDVSRNISSYDNNHEARVTVLAESNSVVRRLTPLECERLQGFPDEWTSGQADQHRYKQMGNAVAVPVVEWIIKRLVGEINA
jgi:DNA (cytosine-5)-methyltransferase 1